MWSRSRIEPVRPLVGAGLVLVVLAGAMLAGCSDIYYDRRETIALSADDAGAADRAQQVIDPWPRDVGRRFRRRQSGSGALARRFSVLPPAGRSGNGHRRRKSQ